MRTLTATEASRAFAALLDEVDAGETFVITRNGRRIAEVRPTSTANGAAAIEFFSHRRADDDFGRDVQAARESARLDPDPWQEG